MRRTRFSARRGLGPLAPTPLQTHVVVAAVVVAVVVVVVVVVVVIIIALPVCFL